VLGTDTKRRIDTARDILVGKVPDPKSQVEQITIATIYKFMDDMDAESEEFGGVRKFFAGAYASNDRVHHIIIEAWQFNRSGHQPFLLLASRQAGAAPGTTR